MREYYKEKIKNLIALRNNLFTCVIVLTGGVTGLFFVNHPSSVLLPFILIGIYFDLIFLLNLLSVNTDINKFIERIK